MDVTRIIPELRSEREEIEQAIHALENGGVYLGANWQPSAASDRLNTGATEVAAQSVIDFTRDRDPNDGSQ